MTDELRAAVERKRVRDTGGTVASDWYPRETTNRQRDDAIIAAAYLAKHSADDGEPVTAEWLKAVGFTPPEWDIDRKQYGERSVALLCPRILSGFEPSFGAMFSDGGNGWEWWAYRIDADEFDGSQDSLCPIPTRGHVLRLFACLNITLTEPG